MAFAEKQKGMAIKQTKKTPVFSELINFQQSNFVQMKENDESDTKFLNVSLEIDCLTRHSY